jgi:IS5 family transposase
MDFLLFADLDEDVPDSTTICRFRSLLISKCLLEKAPKNINRQLGQRNLKVKPIQSPLVPMLHLGFKGAVISDD